MSDESDDELRHPGRAGRLMTYPTEVVRALIGNPDQAAASLEDLVQACSGGMTSWF